MTKCAIENCDRTATKTGLCSMHKRRLQRGSSNMEALPLLERTAACCIEGCLNESVAKGLCRMHYARKRRGADLEKPHRSIKPLPTKHAFYTAWSNMKTRCNNPNSTQYKYYGGRGISYCARWETFWNFYQDMFADWHEGYTLDRIDTNGNYEPGNCRWVTSALQQSNKNERGYLEHTPKK